MVRCTEVIMIAAVNQSRRDSANAVAKAAHQLISSNANAVAGARAVAAGIVVVVVVVVARSMRRGVGLTSTALERLTFSLPPRASFSFSFG